MIASIAALPRGWPGVALALVIVLVAYRHYRRSFRARRELDEEWRHIKDTGSGSGSGAHGPGRTSP